MISERFGAQNVKKQEQTAHLLAAATANGPEERKVSVDEKNRARVHYWERTPTCTVKLDQSTGLQMQPARRGSQPKYKVLGSPRASKSP